MAQADRRRICAQRRCRRRRLLQATGSPLGFGIQTAEKIYQDFNFTATNRGGHSSSRPRPDNAIYELRRRARPAFEAHRFAPMLNETTPGLFTAERAEQDRIGRLGEAMRAWLANPNDGEAADVIEASELEVGNTRTRCVATMLEGGHAANALPQTARGQRQLPDLARESSSRRSEAELQALAGPDVEVTHDRATYKPKPTPRRCARTWSTPTRSRSRRALWPERADHPAHVDRRDRRHLLPRGRDPGLRGRWQLGDQPRRRARPRPRRAHAGSRDFTTMWSTGSRLMPRPRGLGRASRSPLRAPPRRGRAP